MDSRERERNMVSFPDLEQGRTLGSSRMRKTLRVNYGHMEPVDRALLDVYPGVSSGRKTPTGHEENGEASGRGMSPFT